MPKIIEAVYENGVIKPLERVEIREGEIVRIIIEDDVVEKRKRFLEEFRPINVGRKITLKEIKEIRNESVFRY